MIGSWPISEEGLTNVEEEVLVVAVGMFATDASAYYHPGMGVFMSRDPGAGAGGAMQVGAGGAALVGQFMPRDSVAMNPTNWPALDMEPPFPPNAIQFIVYKGADSVPSRTKAQQEQVLYASVQEGLLSQYADGINIYTYARLSPLMYVDREGLSTQCGQMGMTCKSGNKQWPVYGKSGRAKAILGGKEGCVTLLVPKAIFCTGSCSDIKDWNSAGDPSVKILEHEACHACAHEDPCDSYFLSWIPGDLTGHCDRNKKTVTPGW